METSSLRLGGRPKKNISLDELMLSYRKNQNWNIVAREFGICRQTIYKRIKDLDLKRETIYR
jgi:transcriptional regulator of acetoin/glycerol metabolism